MGGDLWRAILISIYEVGALKILDGIQYVGVEI